MGDSYLPPRPATAADLDALVRFRIRMFADMGFESDDGFAGLSAASTVWFAKALADGRYLGWFVARADAPDEIVSRSGMLLMDWPPGIRDIGTVRGYILNVYTEPAHRGRGLATLLTRAAIDEARRRGIHVVTLHASDAGARIYQRLGFEESGEMWLLL